MCTSLTSDDGVQIRKSHLLNPGTLDKTGGWMVLRTGGQASWQECGNRL